MLEAILKWVLQDLPMASIGFGTHLLQNNWLLLTFVVWVMEGNLIIFMKHFLAEIIHFL